MVNDTRDIQYSFLLRSAIAENAQIVLHAPSCELFPIDDMYYVSYGIDFRKIRERLLKDTEGAIK